MSDLQVVSGPFSGLLQENVYRVPAHLSYEQVEREVTLLLRLQEGINWWLGDLLLAAEAQHPAQWSQLVHITGKSEGNIQQVVWVARRFAPEDRVAGLSWTHHFAVAYVRDPKVRRWWLEQALAQGWSKRELYDRIKGVKAVRPVGGTDSFPELPPLHLDSEAALLQEGLDQFMAALKSYRPQVSDRIQQITPWGRVIVILEVDEGDVDPPIEEEDADDPIFE